MGVHDTVHLDRPRACSTCGKNIESVQLSREGALQEFGTGDCISHAEDLAVVREQLYCQSCSELRQYIYLAVFRGIFVGEGDSLEEAKQILDSTHLEKILLFYHDLFRKYHAERTEKRRLDAFMKSVVEWFTQPSNRNSWLFLPYSTYFEGTQDPLEAIKRFLGDKEAVENDKEDVLF